jgi:glycosyltransferase involved in cell wall biosynthesis
LRSQSYQNWHVLQFVNPNTGLDKDSNQSLEADSRILRHSMPTGGTESIIRTALSYTKYKYIFYINNQDQLAPTFLEKCVWFLESNNNFEFCSSRYLGSTDCFFPGQKEISANSSKIFDSAMFSLLARRKAMEALAEILDSSQEQHDGMGMAAELARRNIWGEIINEQILNRPVHLNQDLDKILSEPATESFKDLDFSTAPVILAPMPYDTISDSINVRNPLAKNENDKRILFVIPWMVPGGADRVNLDWISMLLGKGYQITVCATLKANHLWNSEFTDRTPDVFILNNFIRRTDYPRFLVYIINSRKIDTVIITGSTIGYLLLPFLRAHCPGVSFVDLCHVEEPHWLNGGHPRFGIGYQEALDLNLVTTGHLRSWMMERGADGDRISVCHTGVNVPQRDVSGGERDQAYLEFNLRRDIPVIVFAGRLCPQKRPTFLIDIFKQLEISGSHFQAIVIGDGELRLQVEQKIQDCSLKNSVQMLGSVDHEKWLRALAVADIFLLPSEYEGISIALIEAMAMGVVPVTAAVGGQEELISENSGYLIPHGPGEMEQYVGAISTLIGNSELRREIGDSANLRVIDKFGRDACSAAILGALEKAIENSISSPRNVLSQGLALEMATLAIDYTRMSELAGLLWEQNIAAKSKLNI